MIYLDNSATTKVRPEIVKTMQVSYTTVYGNPSSFHDQGLKAKQTLEDSRKTISHILNCQPGELIFTGGGTESINLALKGLADHHPRGHIITSTIEHPAVLDTCKHLESKGHKVTYLDVNREGLINLTKLEKAIQRNTFLITIMYANNEIGTIQNIEAINKIAKKHNVIFHTDACQAGAYLDLNTKDCDLMTLNSSKIYGPKGVGI